MSSSHLPSSFASAAAGQGSGRDSRPVRGDGRGSGDWSRRDPRPANGTLTLRRSSTTPHAHSLSQGEPPFPTPTTEIATSQSQYERSTDTRYSKTQLLEIYRSQQESDVPTADVSRLFVNGWDPGHSNGTGGRGWGKANDGRDTRGPDICWNINGDIQPIGLEEMTPVERALFTMDVNSPLKPPPQNLNKESNAQGNNFGVTSPAASRPGTRRRETSDSTTGLASPAGTSRFMRDEPSPYFSRKTHDSKEGLEDSIEDTKPSSPFGGLIRNHTTNSIIGNGPSSPWGTTSSSSGLPPMGTFGSFALGGSAAPGTPGEKRPGYGSMRGESRLAHLMPKESMEDLSSKTGEKSWRARPRTDTDPYSEENGPSGSAALGGGQDTDSQLHRKTGADTPIREAPGDFGMSDTPGFRDIAQRSQTHQTPQGGHGAQEPLSPDTNPYRSPPEDRRDHEEDGFEGDHPQQNRAHGLGGMPDHAPNAFGNFPRGFPNAGLDGSDRSQTSSVGATKGFPNLASLGSVGLGGMSGWPTSGNSIGTPSRERAGFSGAFGDSLFGAMGAMQSPGVGGLRDMFTPGVADQPTGSQTIGRNSKMGSLFPAAMQAQMQGNEPDGQGEGNDARQNSAFGTIGRSVFPSRDSDSPIRGARHPFEEMLGEHARTQGPFSTSDMAQGQTSTAFSQTSAAQSNYQQSHASSDSASNQLPTAQQRMMVMPDRMRWVYLDPQGQVQGPWSGLEMHDWYKASFFTADLSVKKVEDNEFEPLGQLIRRIGNSREPFLVPQIGIPHGPVTAPPGTAPFAPSSASGAGVPTGSVQPPFAGAFPSFGTTLTAEQQNNLERRKQEEQYLMARQREFLAQQQVTMKHQQMSGLPASLHHHSSAHSLQSQPSFGSMTSPIGMPPQPPLPSVVGFFDGVRHGQVPGSNTMPPDFIREDELARLSLQERQQIFGPASSGPQVGHPQQLNAMFNQHPDAQRDAARMEQARQNDPQGFKTRLREFEQLRAQHEMEEASQSATTQTNDPIGPPPVSRQQQVQDQQFNQQETFELEPEVTPQSGETLSLTQQVQMAASAKHTPTPTAQPESPWGKVSTGLPMPFPPPPQSTTPLPAPTAQRGRSNLPEALAAESRSRSETPEVASAAPSLAPWAKEPTDAPKGPSLKEIQEAEAKKAAKAEEIAVAARRVLHEQEMKAIAASASQAAAPAPGLPMTSTWGSGGSPSTPSSTPSAWNKSTTTKARVPSAGSTSNSKKTLADIQKEEELRKQKVVAASAAAAAAQPVSTSGAGKRYAELAGKTTAQATSPSASLWSTVGAGGKVKIPAGPATAIPAVRTASGRSVATLAATPATRSTPTPRATSNPTGTSAAQDEFVKWAKSSLAKGLNPDINVDNFVLMLSSFPPEAGIIADSVYANSQLMDGRRFAEEFLRRRKLAEKGIIEPSGGAGFSTATDKSGGWNEVAKKNPPKEEPASGFKVVPNKKKGKK